MHTYISILRGINVSGHNLIKMNALQEMYMKLGFEKVQTYIQSGNVVFQCHEPSAKRIEDMISAGILNTFGFEVPVLVLGNEELLNISANNNFITERNEDITKLHVTFLSGVPDKTLSGTIGKQEFMPDEFNISGRSVYVFCPNGYGNTKLSNNFFEKKLKVRATTRNWKTILELVNISNSLK